MNEVSTQDRLRHEARILETLPITTTVAQLMREAADELDHLKKAASLPQHERGDYITGYYAGKKDSAIIQELRTEDDVQRLLRALFMPIPSRRIAEEIIRDAFAVKAP